MTQRPTLVLLAALLSLPLFGVALDAAAEQGDATVLAEKLDLFAQRRRRRRQPQPEEPPPEEATATTDDAGAPVAETPPPAEGEAAATEQEPAHTTGVSLRRSNHMEFDARLVRGETAGSGAVILFERAARRLPPLTKQRTRFLAATLEPVLGDRPETPEEAPAPVAVDAGAPEPTEAVATEPATTEDAGTPRGRRRRGRLRERER